MPILGGLDSVMNSLSNVAVPRGFRAATRLASKAATIALTGLAVTPGFAFAAATTQSAPAPVKPLVQPFDDRPAAPAAAAATTAAPATGGVFERAPAGEVKADPQFRSLFLSWKKLDQVAGQQSAAMGPASIGVVSIPSVKPVAAMSFTSNFGFRSDPFRGGRAMHAGVDIPGPVGTPIYATADGIVGRAQRLGGYGNYIEIEHGSGIQTRYGHLSRIMVASGTRVVKGQEIGKMGSTGRSTGSHLHYEVRLDGRAVNPMPFLQSSDYLVAMKARERGAVMAMGGPAKAETAAALPRAH